MDSGCIKSGVKSGEDSVKVTRKQPVVTMGTNQMTGEDVIMVIDTEESVLSHVYGGGEAKVISGTNRIQSPVSTLWSLTVSGSACLLLCVSGINVYHCQLNSYSAIPAFTCMVLYVSVLLSRPAFPACSGLSVVTVGASTYLEIVIHVQYSVY